MGAKQMGEASQQAPGPVRLLERGATKPWGRRFNSPEVNPMYERAGFLLWRARHIANSIFTHECQGFGVTSAQYLVLTVVKENPGIDQAGVSRYAGLDRFTTALVVSNLMRRNFVARERHASDHRRYTLAPTPRGLTLLKRMLPAVVRTRARILSPFTASQRKVFIRMLQHFVTELNNDARAPVYEDALPGRAP